MEELKMALTRAPALVKITYGEDSGEIILATDASGGGWGAVLMQLDEKGLRHLLSSHFTIVEGISMEKLSILCYV
jgi:hypothetical protein